MSDEVGQSHQQHEASVRAAIEVALCACVDFGSPGVDRSQQLAVVVPIYVYEASLRANADAARFGNDNDRNLPCGWTAAQVAACACSAAAHLAESPPNRELAT